ncbi:MAG: multiheme c-type cytochrome, partial [Planctomycetota bacterium]
MLQSRTAVLLSLVALICGLAVASFMIFSGRDETPALTSTESHPETLHQPTSRQAYQSPSHTGFVGSAACSECHPEIAATYSGHPMAQSFRRIDELDWSAYPTGTAHRVNSGSRVLEVQCSETEHSHHELLFDQSGALIYDTAYPMTYVVGSGNRALAFLRTQEDALLASAINWYANRRGWGLAPGYTPNDLRRFDRRARDACVACHTGAVKKSSGLTDRFTPETFLDMQIGCEKCHGPGAEHIAFHGGESPVSTSQPLPSTDPIVNPAQLDPLHRDSVCYQCHLQGAARVLRPGRSDFDFRPGQSFADIWTVVVADSGIGSDGRTRAISHVLQMHDSRCFAESEGRLGCISCHDPHRIPAADEKFEFYRQRCLN